MTSQLPTPQFSLSLEGEGWGEGEPWNSGNQDTLRKRGTLQ